MGRYGAPYTVTWKVRFLRSFRHSVHIIALHCHPHCHLLYSPTATFSPSFSHFSYLWRTFVALFDSSFTPSSQSLASPPWRASTLVTTIAIRPCTRKVCLYPKPQAQAQQSSGAYSMAALSSPQTREQRVGPSWPTR